jgi:hypothetical protein
MRHLLFISCALIAAPAAAQEPGTPPPSSPTVVVTANNVQSLRARLAACIARGCPPNEEIDAALALAQAQFESGDADNARLSIQASLDRNRRHARQYAEPVADLYRSLTRVDRHLGRDDEATRSAYSTFHTLKDAFPQEDERHFVARLEIAEMLYNQTDPSPTSERRVRQGRRALMSLAANARRAGREDVALYADLRATWMGYLLSPYGPAFDTLTRMANDRAPRHRYLATGAKILLARIHRDRGETARSDAMIAEAARALAGRRNLIFSPPYELYVGPMLAGSTNNAQFENQSIDVGFFITADGRVRDLEVVRHRGSPDWARPLLPSIRGRIYSTSADGMPTYRLERYTYTAGRGQATGSRLSTRIGQPRVEYYDLSAEAAGETPPAPASPAPAPAH